MDEQTYRESVKKFMNGSLTFNEKLVNFALGLCGESAELDYVISEGQREKVIDEAGDCRWYFTALNILLEASSIYEHSFPPAYYLSAQYLSREMMREAGRVADLIKKVVFHKHSLDKHKEQILNRLRAFSWKYNALLIKCDFTDEEVKQYNVNKLAARYKDLVFTTEQSINRNNELQISA
jgi:hypothetical protein